MLNDRSRELPSEKRNLIAKEEGVEVKLFCE